MKAVNDAKKAYEEHMSRSSRVKEDDLENLNLGTADNPKNVRISVNLTTDFRQNLKQLLFEFKDIFAWHYTDMKGVNPNICQHKINLKKDAVPVIQK